MTEVLLIAAEPRVKVTRKCPTVKINQHAGDAGVPSRVNTTPCPIPSVLPSSPGGTPATYPLCYRLEMWLRNQVHKGFVIVAWLKCKAWARSKYAKGYVKAHRGARTTWERKVGGE